MPASTQTLALGGVAGPLVEAADGHLGVQLDLARTGLGGHPVGAGEQQRAQPLAPARAGHGHPAEAHHLPGAEQAAGADHSARVLDHQVQRGRVLGVVLQLHGNALLLAEDGVAQRQHRRDLAGAGPARERGRAGGAHRATTRATRAPTARACASPTPEAS